MPFGSYRYSSPEPGDERMIRERVESSPFTVDHARVLWDGSTELVEPENDVGPGEAVAEHLCQARRVLISEMSVARGQPFVVLQTVVSFHRLLHEEVSAAGFQPILKPEEGVPVLRAVLWEPATGGVANSRLFGGGVWKPNMHYFVQFELEGPGGEVLWRQRIQEEQQVDHGVDPWARLAIRVARSLRARCEEGR